MIRLGIVGCGSVTQIIHLPSLLQLADKFRVTALCDVSPAVLREVGERWQVDYRFLDYRELVSLETVDAVLVANPDAYHSEVVLAALAAGKHVLVEKPMCLTLREADAIIAAQEKAQRVVQVGYMRRYAPAFIRACELVGAMPEVQLARVHDVIGSNRLFIEGTSRVIQGDDVPRAQLEAGRAQQQALVTEAIGEAPEELQRAYRLLLGLSSHDLSAMRELLGLPKKVLYAAYRQNGSYISAAFDYGGFICHFETGIHEIPHFDAHLEVYSAERIVRVQYNTPYVRNLPVTLTVTDRSEGGVSHAQSQPAWGDPFVAQWQAFYDSVTFGRAVKTSPQDFRCDLRLFGDMIRKMRLA